MGLVIGLDTGEKVRIDNKATLVVTQVESLRRVHVECQGQAFILRDDQAAEVYPNVYVHVGLPEGLENRREVSPRLVFDAPREIRLRKLYR